MEYEYCSVCDNKTGKAGPGDGSLYTDSGEGPFCETCFHFQEQIEALVMRISELESDITSSGRASRQAATAALYVANLPK